MKCFDFPQSSALAIGLMGLLNPATHLAGALVLLALTVGTFIHLGWKASKWLQANTMRSAGKLDAGVGLVGVLIFSHWLSPPADTIVAAVALSGLAILLTFLLRRLEPPPIRAVSYGAFL
jgi:hypothetical protein